MNAIEPAATAGRVTPRSAGHAAFALISFTLDELVATGAIAPARARLLVGRAAAWADLHDPAAAALLDALSGRIARR